MIQKHGFHAEWHALGKNDWGLQTKRQSFGIDAKKMIDTILHDYKQIDPSSYATICIDGTCVFDDKEHWKIQYISHYVFMSEIGDKDEDEDDVVIMLLRVLKKELKRRKKQ